MLRLQSFKIFIVIFTFSFTEFNIYSREITTPCHDLEYPGQQAEEVLSTVMSTSPENVNLCSPEERIQHREETHEILAECNANWENWGIDPIPDASELRDPENCSKGLQSWALQTGYACANALIAIPVMLAQLGAYAIVSLLPIDKTTYSYVIREGTEQDAIDFVYAKFERELCGIAKREINGHVDKKCPMTERETNSHLNPEGARACRTEALEEIDQARSCFSSRLRPSFRENRESIDSEIQEMVSLQNELRRIETEKREKLAQIKRTCEVFLNPLRGNMAFGLLMPVTYTAIDLQSRAFPDEERVAQYNQCVQEQAANDPELVEDLKKSSLSIIDRLIGSTKSYQCYNELTRKEIVCGAAMAVIGAAGPAMLRFLGRKLGNRFARSNTKFADIEDMDINPRTAAATSERLDAFTLSERVDFEVLRRTWDGLSDTQKRARISALAQKRKEFLDEIGVPATIRQNENGFDVLVIKPNEGRAGNFWSRIEHTFGDDTPDIVFDPSELVEGGGAAYSSSSNQILLGPSSLDEVIRGDLTSLKHELRHARQHILLTRGEVNTAHGRLHFSPAAPRRELGASYQGVTQIDEALITYPKQMQDFMLEHRRLTRSLEDSSLSDSAKSNIRSQLRDLRSNFGTWRDKATSFNGAVRDTGTSIRGLFDEAVPQAVPDKPGVFQVRGSLTQVMKHPDFGPNGIVMVSFPAVRNGAVVEGAKDMAILPLKDGAFDRIITDPEAFQRYMIEHAEDMIQKSDEVMERVGELDRAFAS